MFSSSLLLILTLALGSASSAPGPLAPRLNNGLALTPPMGWNTYNHYSCNPNETIIHSNAQALVDLGLQAVGYHYVTVDCGWALSARSAQGTLQPNPALFPSGYPALGQFLHGLGLGFGVYSDGGIQMCSTGAVSAGSLGHEQVDANTFASWGADSLKYDNCYSESAQGFPDVTYTPNVSPQARYQAMEQALLATGRPMVFHVCEWGVDFPALWAPALGNSWRMSNDIIPSFGTVARILNQAVPQTDFAGPGHWMDLDMLEVGNNIFTTAEEQTHFSMWAILKSPLIIGAALKDAFRSISAASLAIYKNTAVISYNQDSLGVAASLRRRFTEEGYEVWAGPLSGNRMVVAVINLQNVATQLTLDLPDVGLQTAATIKSVWDGITTTNVVTSYTASVQPHGIMLLELSGTTPVGTYTGVTTKLPTSTFSKVYAATTSSSYTALLTFASTLAAGSTVTVNGVSFTIKTASTTLSVTGLALTAGNNNIITVTSNIAPTSLTLTPPTATFFPATAFTVSGEADHVTCSTGLCVPVGAKIGFLDANGFATLSITAPTAGSKFVDIYFCNNDIAFSSAFSTGTNTRNMTISVNGVVTRIEAPLSGRSSELFSVALGWEDTGIFGVLIDGWKAGANQVVIGNTAGGLVGFAPDLVGMGILM